MGNLFSTVYRQTEVRLPSVRPLAFLVVKSAIQEHAIAAQSPRGEECYPGARARGLVARWNQEEAGLHRSRRVSTHPLPPPHSKCTNDPAAPHYEHEDIR
ncbi:unnamed protein product [Arctogadus glacialis]